VVQDTQVVGDKGKKRMKAMALQRRRRRTN
jgi:hypothetical protein